MQAIKKRFSGNKEHRGQAQLCDSTNPKRRIAQRLTAAIVNVIGIDMNLMSFSVVTLMILLDVLWIFACVYPNSK